MKFTYIKNMSRKRIIILLLCVSLIVTYLIFSSAKQESFSYLTETVKRGNLQTTVLATGTVRAYNRVEVGAQVSGKIEKIYVTLGQQVKKGDLIAEIDSATQQNNLDTAEAKLASYQTQLNARKISLEIAKSFHQRASKLYKNNSLSLEALENAQKNLASTEANIGEIEALIQQAKIDVNNAKTNLGYTKIVSPIDATVISIPVSEGQIVNANQSTPTIVQVADLSKMLIKPEIPEGDITKVKAGMNVEFSILSDPTVTYHAVIDSVDPGVTALTDGDYSERASDARAVYYYANVLFDNTENKLRIGMTTQFKIIIADIQNTLLIPTMVIKRQGEKTFVNVLREKDQVETREITVGQHNDIYSEVLTGLEEGEQVISTQIAPGEVVGRVRF